MRFLNIKKNILLFWIVTIIGIQIFGFALGQAAGPTPIKTPLSLSSISDEAWLSSLDFGDVFTGGTDFSEIDSLGSEAGLNQEQIGELKKIHDLTYQLHSKGKAVDRDEMLLSLASGKHDKGKHVYNASPPDDATIESHKVAMESAKKDCLLEVKAARKLLEDKEEDLRILLAEKSYVESVRMNFFPLKKKNPSLDPDDYAKSELLKFINGPRYQNFRSRKIQIFKNSEEAKIYLDRHEEILKTKLLRVISGAMIEIHYSDKDKTELNLYREKVQNYNLRLKNF